MGHRAEPQALAKATKRRAAKNPIAPRKKSADFASGMFGPPLHSGVWSVEDDEAQGDHTMTASGSRSGSALFQNSRLGVCTVIIPPLVPFGSIAFHSHIRNGASRFDILLQ